MTDKNSSQITPVNNVESEMSPENTRRDFIRRFGKLAVVTPVALTALMTPNTSHAVNSNACKKSQDKKVCDRLNANSGF
ncbi:hypothetical protein [Thalassomonas sp. M1454]|uniref:hypothetical protein n=1 Tax=Thalassomonas sp. M1454 TaxID=2594477 RepID=UPI001180D0F7|nr:hypothetical protein [Thalassomonas sp. M1454]TRX57220.1 hypothetical protein FNN08_06895 [Thalassomonas sp. M1454]